MILSNPFICEKKKTAFELFTLTINFVYRYFRTRQCVNKKVDSSEVDFLY